jgi:anti-sigma regulatory factor (Ser/Thr protein kinase)
VAMVEGGDREMGCCELPLSVAAPAIARDFVADTLRLHHLEPLISITQLLTSEAVTNAVLHAQSTSVLRMIFQDGRIRVSVSDLGHGEPRLQSPKPETTTGGRGLMIINLLAERWGTIETLSGNEVWFELEPNLNISTV